jgi:hypothetical protein
MLKRPLINATRYALIAVGLLAAINSVLTGARTGADGAKLHSPDYGWFLHEWAASFVVASVAFVAAVMLSRGWSRWLLIVLLALTWSNGMRPGWQLLAYYGVSGAP